MDFNGFNSFQDFMNFYGYNFNNQNNPNNNSQSAFDDGQIPFYGANDIPGGFQNLNPELFILIGELLGNVMAGNMPFNVQNAIGNWLELVGQAIETYNAQQQYQQNGPGRYYSPANTNVGNPFSSNTNGGSNADDNQASVDGNSTSSSSASNNNMTKEINDLKNCCTAMIQEIEALKKEIEDLKN